MERESAETVDENILSDKAKRMIMMAADSVMIPIALWAAVALRYGDLYQDVTVYWWLFPTSSVICIPAFYKFGLYRAIVRYIGPSSMVPVLKGVTIAAIGISLVAYLTKSTGFPRSSPAIFWFISIMLVGGSRLAVRAYFYGIFNDYLTREPVAIYGAGDSGAQLAIALLSGTAYMPVAFIDDNRNLRRNIIHGIRVYDAAHLLRLIDQFGIKQILLAVPSATHDQRKRILNRLAELPVRIRTIPGISDLVSGCADVSEIREVDIEDLLGRDTVPPDPELLAASVTGKNVMVTGGGGSIGSELSRIIVKQYPNRLVLLDNSEFSLYQIEKDLNALLRELKVSTELIFLLGSVRDQSFVEKVLSNLSIHTVYHAAAYKHVSMVEQNIIEGIKNNVFGTLATVLAAEKTGLESFVYISSDKAVRPTNIMGATKRLSEQIIQAKGQQSSNTKYCMVRFGNVLASSGSVIPLFREQIEKGGPVTVTHSEATRYFMTISEAAELVIQAGAMASGGELYVLDMEDQVRIEELAEKMIKLSGRTIRKDGEGDIAVEFTGLRHGEKLAEELLIGGDMKGTRHPRIMQAKEDYLGWEELNSLMRELQSGCDSFSITLIEAVLSRAVNGFRIADKRADVLLSVNERGAADHDQIASVTPLHPKEDAT